MNNAYKKIPGIPAENVGARVAKEVNKKPAMETLEPADRTPEQKPTQNTRETLAENKVDMRQSIESALTRMKNATMRELRIAQKSLASLPEALQNTAQALESYGQRAFADPEEDPDDAILAQKPQGMGSWIKGMFGRTQEQPSAISSNPTPKENRGMVFTGGELFRNIAKEMGAVPERLSAFLEEFGVEGLERQRTEAREQETRAWHEHADALQKINRARRELFAQQDRIDEAAITAQLAALDEQRADADYAYQDAVARAENLIPGTAEAIIKSTISMAASGIPRALAILSKETASLFTLGGALEEYGGKLKTTLETTLADAKKAIPERAKIAIEGVRHDVQELGKDLRNLQSDFSATTQAILLNQTYTERSIHRNVLARRMEQLSIRTQPLPMEQAEIKWIQETLQRNEDSGITREILENIEGLLTNLDERANSSLRARDREAFSSLAGYITARALERVKNLSGIPDNIQDTLINTLREAPTPDNLRQVEMALFAMQEDTMRLEGMDYLTPNEIQEIETARKETAQVLAQVTELYEQSFHTQVDALKKAVTQAKRNLTLAQAELATEDETEKIGLLAAK